MPSKQSNLSIAAVLLSCEHGGTRIPVEYRKILPAKSWVLSTHRGSDLHIAKVYKRLAGKLTRHCYFNDISRLLCDFNRSEDSPELFSQYVSKLSHEQRSSILEQLYHPYRDKIRTDISKISARGTGYVVHISLHSFTPQLKGKRRTAQVGLLYDPAVQAEVIFAKRLKETWKQLSPRTSVQMNYPYRGTDDGFTVALRKEFRGRYIGLEIELNQKYAKLGRTPEVVYRAVSGAIEYFD